MSDAPKSREYTPKKGTGGVRGFEGFRYAIRDEVITLFINHGFSDIDGGFTVDNDPFIDPFVALHNLTKNDPTTPIAFGFALRPGGG